MNNSHYLWSFIVLVASFLTNISLVNGEVNSSTTSTKTIPIKTVRDYTAVPFITYQTTKTPPKATKALYNFSVENPPVVKSVKTAPFVKTSKELPDCFGSGTKTAYYVGGFTTKRSTYYCKGVYKREAYTGKVLTTTTTGKTIPSVSSTSTSTTRTGKTIPSTSTTSTSTTRTGKTIPSTSTRSTSTTRTSTIPTCYEMATVSFNDLINGAQIFTSKIQPSSTISLPVLTTDTTTTTITTTSTKSVPNIVTVTEEITKELTVTNEVTVTNNITVTKEVTVTAECSCATSTPTQTSCSKRYEQCGGKYYDGPTCCESGKCQKVNEFYSQCV